MNTQELDELAASVTPEKVRQVALAIWRKRRHRELRAVQLYRIVKALGANAETGESREYWRAWGRLREAGIAAANQTDDMTYIAAT